MLLWNVDLGEGGGEDSTEGLRKTTWSRKCEARAADAMGYELPTETDDAAFSWDLTGAVGCRWRAEQLLRIDDPGIQDKRAKDWAGDRAGVWIPQ